MDNQNLPLELLRPIIEHLNDDLPSLLAVSLVSSALRVEGQRLLFRTVALSENVRGAYQIPQCRNFLYPSGSFRQRISSSRSP
jgi:hypothetical protein